ncbi:hypothetical protein ABFA07_006167 [Porites harrisoni]
MVNTYKVVLCGKTGVGKTSIFRRMCGSDLDSPQKGCARNTLDPVECNVSVELEKETKIKFNLWDTAGLEQHATLTRSHYLLSQAVLIVYSVNDEESLSQAIEILKFAKIHAQGACFILITNKIDLEPTFTEDKLRSSIPKNAFVLQFRTSALTGEGIQDMLHKLASHLNKRATPMKSTGRSCLGNCNDKSASYNLDAGVVQLQFEDTHQRRRRRRKCCSS